MKWGETKYHAGKWESMPYQESVEPRGYTIISHGYQEQRIFTASYDGKPEGAPAVGRLAVPCDDSRQKKAAVSELRRLCAEHYAKITQSAESN